METRHQPETLNVAGAETTVSVEPFLWLLHPALTLRARSVSAADCCFRHGTLEWFVMQHLLWQQLTNSPTLTQKWVHKELV